MFRLLVVVSLAFVVVCPLTHAEEGLLIHWTFDAGAGRTAKDASGNRLDGVVKAEWAESPAGQGLLLDGTAPRVVSIALPDSQRFGTSSWTFMAMVKPITLTIDDPQNQRRIFSFGEFPEAILVVDLTATGLVQSYFCYRNETGEIVAANDASALRVAAGEWAHVAVVCNRDAGRIWSYVNGYSRGPSEMPPEFAGDFVVGGELTIGNEWHNYWGMVDEVRIYRRALTSSEVAAHFGELKEIFNVQESEEAIIAKNRDRIEQVLAEASRAWAAGDFAAVRTQCQVVLAAADVPPHMRSCAHLRLAQSHLAGGDAETAMATYATIEAEVAYPAVHRVEAGDCLRELRREQRGLAGRDPTASRTVVPTVSTVDAEVFVAPHGSDADDGSRARPFATLTRARDAVRAIKAAGVDGAIAVTLMPGEYVLTETFELTAEDSGTREAPILYRAEKKGTAILYGGMRLSDFAPVTDRETLDRLPAAAQGRVVRCDLRAQGITDYGELAVRGFAQPPAPPTLELYVDRRPMTLARWPNEGFVGIERLVEAGSPTAGKPSVFEYQSDRHARWTRAEDAWLFGYFQFLWADATIAIGAIDTSARTITTARSYNYGGRGMSAEQGIIYYAFNLLEELDQPGEWYLDRAAGVLYLYPPTDLAAATVEIGMLSTPMVIAQQVSDVRFEGLTFDLSRYDAIHIVDGVRCLVAGCVVNRMAGNGITITGGEENGILGCDIHTLGRRATEVIGGDRETLRPGRHFVENCQLHDFGRIDRTYTPAIQLEGVGNRVAHNLMYDCPSSAMRIEGNDHIIEFNDVFDAVRESDDQGAMELFRNATYRGVVFRHNRFRNIGKTGTEVAVHGQAAIRLDDAISGILVYGNIFERSANGHFGGVQMNSGRDNTIDNNLFIDCKQGISGGWNEGNPVWQDLLAGKPLEGFYTSELYLSRYPEMAHMLEAPGINHVWRNAFFRSGPMVTGNRANLDLFANEVIADGDPKFGNASFLSAMGFRPIPVEEIGLYDDAYRATWPVTAVPAPTGD